MEQNAECTARAVPMRLLCLGLSRTGTVSLQQALHDLGVSKVYHQSDIFKGNFADAPKWNAALEAKFAGGGQVFTKRDWDELLGDYAAVSDVPSIIFADELIAAYPAAKVILTVRDTATQWQTSMQKTILQAYRSSDAATSTGNPDAATSSFVHMNNLVRKWHYQDFRTSLEQLYHDHNARIFSLVPAQNLLVFNVKDGWAPLCRFLDVPVPAHDFPSRNSAAEFVSAGKEFMKDQWLDHESVVPPCQEALEGSA